MILKVVLADLMDCIDNAEIADFFAKIDLYYAESKITITDLALLNNLRKEFLYGKNSYDYYDKLKLFAKSNIKVKKSKTTENVRTFQNMEEKFIGLVIENYKIERFIGAGGFGMVFMGVHELLKNEVAIKISYEIMEEYSAIKNLLQNSLLGVRQLNHPYIAKIMAMGEIVLFDSVRIYVIMEMIKGGNLAILPKNDLTKIEISNRIDLFIKICESLAYAHQFVYHNQAGFQVTGVMHGDIKPLNILLENENTPKIIDFMFIDLNKLEKTRVARPDFSVSQHSVTSDMGTVGYMDKEQKEKGIVTPQTEIYSLGITLFEIFSPKEFSIFQEKLFSNGFLGLQMGDTSLKLLYDWLTNYNQLLKPEICQIILKCIQDNPHNRYKSVAELIIDLKNTQQKRSLWTFFRKIFGFK